MSIGSSTNAAWRGPGSSDRSPAARRTRVVAPPWFGNGEAQPIRRTLLDTGLPEFVGAIGAQAPYGCETPKGDDAIMFEARTDAIGACGAG